jgi:hypothetical protein
VRAKHGFGDTNIETAISTIDAVSSGGKLANAQA